MEAWALDLGALRLLRRTLQRVSALKGPDGPSRLLRRGRRTNNVAAIQALVKVRPGPLSQSAPTIPVGCYPSRHTVRMRKPWMGWEGVLR